MSKSSTQILFNNVLGQELLGAQGIVVSQLATIYHITQLSSLLIALTEAKTADLFVDDPTLKEKKILAIFRMHLVSI